MRQHKGRDMIRRIVSPPTFPRIIRPGSTDWAKHIATQDPGAESTKPLFGDFIINSGLTVRLTVHFPPCACVEEPFHQFWPIDTKWILKVLIRAGTITVNRHRKAVHYEFWHGNHLNITALLRCHLVA